MRWGSPAAAALLVIASATNAQACPIRIGTIEAKDAVKKRVMKRLVEKVLKPEFQRWEGPRYVDNFNWQQSRKLPWQVGRAWTKNPEGYGPLKLDLVFEIEEGLEDNQTSVSISYWKASRYEQIESLEDFPIGDLGKLRSQTKLKNYLTRLRKRCE